MNSPLDEPSNVSHRHGVGAKRPRARAAAGEPHDAHTARALGNRGQHDLQRLQTWLLSRIRMGAFESADAGTDPHTAGAELRPTRRLTPADSLRIHQRMFALRLEGALSDEYPLVRRAVGATQFTRLVQDYVADRPPRSFDLGLAGARFPEWIATRPAVRCLHPQMHTSIGAPCSTWLADLARVERAESQVLDAAAAPTLTPAQAQSVADEAWQSARLEPHPALRLLALDCPVLATYDVLARGGSPSVPLRHPSFVVVQCTGSGVRRHILPRRAFELFRDLAADVPLAEAIAKQFPGELSEHQARRLRSWFSNWVALGVFRSIAVRVADASD
jgi:hypothetical protein